MLYYYDIKQKRRLWAKRWLVATILSVTVWTYFYIGSFANVTNSMLPKLQNQILPGFYTNIDPSKSKVPPKVLKNDSATPSMTFEQMQKVRADFIKEGKDKEAAELEFCLNLYSKEKNGESGESTDTAKKRTRIISQDIAKTINYFKAGNTTSRTAQILGNYDGGYIAYVYYPNYGLHFNPVTTANMAIDRYEKKKYKEVVKIADALLANAVVKQYPKVGSYYFWENYFDLEFGPYKFSAPWGSGMAQGLILDVVGKAYKITGDQKYLKAGDMILNSFKVPWNEGGVTDSDEHGNMYLEIAATNKIRILNGFLFTLTSMNNYYEITKSAKVKKLFDVGINEAAAHVGEYDLGYWSNYSLVPGNKANYGYHKIHVDLLERLYRASKNQQIKKYADKFDFYMKNRFIDIPPTHPSFTPISWLTERGIIESKDGWFSARNDITRAEFIKWIVLANKWQPATVYQGCYRDIWRDQPDWPYLESARAHGLNIADRDGNFKPSSSLSRAEVAWILCKVYQIDSEKDPDKNPVEARDIIGNPFEKQIRIAVSNGLMDLFEPNYFRPDINVNREQAATIIYNTSPTSLKATGTQVSTLHKAK